MPGCDKGWAAFSSEGIGNDIGVFFLNIQVEENYPRLLEQVAVIEQLDSAHSQFQHEMDAVAKKADQLAAQMAQQVGRVRGDVLAIENLTKIGRLLRDAIK
jgi:hypothetical protein